MHRESRREYRARLAGRLRVVMTEHAPMVSASNPEASAVGVGWREGALRFVVQTPSAESAAILKARLPEQVEGFPVATEVSRLPDAADLTMDSYLPRRHLNPFEWLSWRISEFFIPH